MAPIVDNVERDNSTPVEQVQIKVDSSAIHIDKIQMEKQSLKDLVNFEATDTKQYILRVIKSHII